MADGKTSPVHGIAPRASALNIGNFCTIVLVDIENRPVMNLHKVPQYVRVIDIKKKISERLKEVGRNLPADLTILKFGENHEIEMVDEKPLTDYNTMALSRIQVQIIKRQKFDITVVVVKQSTVGKCMCIKGNSKEELPFTVRVPSSCYVKQLRMEVARRMNCGIDRHELELFSDPQLQEPIVVEGTCRARGIHHNATVYTKCPPNFNLKNLAPIDIPRQDASQDERKGGAEAAAQTHSEDILTDSTEPEEDKSEPKSAMQINFEKRAGKSLVMNTEQAAAYARSLGYSPSAKDLKALPDKIDYKAFQTFLTNSLHAEDLAETFQGFFSIFDVDATGDLSAKQLCNIMQMYGEEPLSKQEAAQFTQLIMGKDKVAPIKVIVERIMEGQV